MIDGMVVPPMTSAALQNRMLMNPTARRDPNLDLLRAIAILLVLIFHTTGDLAAAGPATKYVTEIGAFGVDLFFVLSGWLIGGLWFREQRQYSNVKPLRFLGRRWLRTLPPYYVALAIAWGAVYFARHEKFDFGYLAFFQNYYRELPFFTVSWSLCVEEHFYLLLPWVLIAAMRWRPIGWILPIVLFIVPPIWRWYLLVKIGEPKFNYMMTATHLHCEGLMLGVVAAAISAFQPAQWKRIKRIARWLAIPGILIFLSMSVWPESMRYAAGYTVLALIWVTLLAAVESEPAILGADSKLIYAIAISSYSVYLIHAIALHLVSQVVNRLHISSSILHLAIAIVGIVISGGVFYFCIERTAIQLRDRLLGRRATKAAVGVEGGVV
jgi:peptidoglycan/LPS O-acetylase OafA/YrhL